MNFLGKLLINFISLLIVDYLIPGLSFTSLSASMVTAVVFGIINTFIKPILQIIALPISIVTFGIAAFLINVMLLWFTSMIVPGFYIANFLTAVIASIALSLVSSFLNHLSR